MDDLITLLRAQLDEDDDAQREPYCSDGWHANHCALHNDVYPREDCDCGVPARQLADVAAKRQIIDRCERAFRDHFDQFAEVELAEEVLKTLALPSAGHPDYREEWKP